MTAGECAHPAGTGLFNILRECVKSLPLLIVKPISVSVEWDESAIVSSSTNLTLSSLKEIIPSPLIHIFIMYTFCCIYGKGKRTECVLGVHRAYRVFIGQIYLLKMTGALLFFFLHRCESANDNGMALHVKPKRGPQLFPDLYFQRISGLGTK